MAAELRPRKLQGFQVTLDIQSLKQETKPPRAGGRLPQLAVGVRVSVFGTTIPEAKLAFGGDGEATIEAEFVERRKDEETAEPDQGRPDPGHQAGRGPGGGQAVAAQVQAVQREQEAAQADMTRRHLGLRRSGRASPAHAGAGGPGRRGGCRKPKPEVPAAQLPPLQVDRTGKWLYTHADGAGRFVTVDDPAGDPAGIARAWCG